MKKVLLFFTPFFILTALVMWGYLLAYIASKIPNSDNQFSFVLVVGIGVPLALVTGMAMVTEHELRNKKH